jgi:hypothetical protein
LPHRRPAAASHLKAPPADPGALHRFPARILPAGAEVHRIHLADRSAWYFNATDASRFTPRTIAGLGACHLAERPVAGLLETFKGLTVVDEEDVLRRRHFRAALRKQLRLADCCVPGAGRHGVNGEIHTTTDYEITQAWASAFASAGFAGIRYLCRSDPGMSLVGYALFDEAGEPPPRRWPAGEDTPIGEDVLREAESFGLSVRPTP